MHPKMLPGRLPGGLNDPKMCPGGFPGCLLEAFGRRSRIFKASGIQLGSAGGRFRRPCWAQKLRNINLKSRPKSSHHFHSHFYLSGGLWGLILDRFWSHLGMILGSCWRTCKFVKIVLPPKAGARFSRFQGVRKTRKMHQKRPGNTKYLPRASWGPPGLDFGAMLGPFSDPKNHPRRCQKNNRNSTTI